jgi:hypothetical protein
MKRKPMVLAGAAAITMTAAACSSTPATKTGTETISGTESGALAAALVNTNSNVSPVFPVFSYSGVVNTTDHNYKLPGNGDAATATDTFVTSAGNLTVTHTRTYQPAQNTPPSLTGQTGTTCLFTLTAEKGTYVTVPGESTGQFADATGHGNYLITLHIGATLPAGKTVCALADFGANGPKAIPTGTSFVFTATGPLTVKS